MDCRRNRRHGQAGYHALIKGLLSGAPSRVPYQRTEQIGHNGRMFHYDGGLKITRIDLAVDVRRRQPRGFISHAHSDHMAPHELALCTPATAALYQHRYGTRQVKLLPFGQRLAWDGATLSTWPAGHIFGSAMLLIEEGDRSLLYTGDFKLSASCTAGVAQPPKARPLARESTFGEPP